MAVNRTDGLETVLRNLNKAISKIEGGTLDGLFEGGLLVQRTSQQRVPVEWGNLKGSADTKKDQAGAMAVHVFYTAAYAVFVHEDMEARHEVGQAKYLESAVYDRESDILRAVQRRARVER